MKIISRDQLKDGMKVKCRFLGRLVEDGEIEFYDNKAFIIRKDIETIRRINLYDDSGDQNSFITDLETIERTLRDAVVGDILRSGAGRLVVVLAVHDKLIAISDYGDREALDGWYTWEQLEGYNYKLKDSESVVDNTNLDKIFDDHKIAQIQAAQRKIMEYAKKVNKGWVPDWSDNNQPKYHSFFDYIDNQFYRETEYKRQSEPSGMYFRSDNLRYKATVDLRQEYLIYFGQYIIL